MIDIDFFRARLTERRAELMRRLEQIEDWLDETPDPDVEERATEREFDEVFEAQGLAGQDEVKAIDAALKRMDNDIYGICLSCHRQISEERLKAVPYAVRCRNCME